MSSVLVQKLSDVRDFRKILETTVKEIGEKYSADISQIILSNPLDSNFTSICEYLANPDDTRDDLPFSTFPLHLEGGGLGLLNLSRKEALSYDESNEIRITLAEISDLVRYAQINDLVQRDTFRGAFMSEINNLMSLPMGLGDALFMVVNILGKALSCSRCIFVCVDDSPAGWKCYEYWQRDRIVSAQDYGWPSKDSSIVSQTLLSQVPIVLFEGQANSYKTPLQEEMEFIGVCSQLSVSIRSQYAVHGCIILQQCETRHAWTRDEIDIAQSAADTVAEALAQLPDEKRDLEPIMRLHQRPVADTFDPSEQSIQDLRKALKGALGQSAIPKAQKSNASDLASNASNTVSIKQEEILSNPPLRPGKPTASLQKKPLLNLETSETETNTNTILSTTSPPGQQYIDPFEINASATNAVNPEQEVRALNERVNLNYTQANNSLSESVSNSANSSGELYNLANILEDTAQEASTQSELSPSSQSSHSGSSFKSVLGGILGNAKMGASSGAWDLGSSEQPPPPPAPPQKVVPPDPFQQGRMAGVQPPSPPNKPASRWGDLDAIPTPGQVNSNSATGIPAVSPPVPGTNSSQKIQAASKWGDLDAIQAPKAQVELSLSQQPQALNNVPVNSPTTNGNSSASNANSESSWGNLDAIPTPSKTQSSGLGGMMMGRAKASGHGAGGLGASLGKTKGPSPSTFVEGPPIQIDDAAAEAKLKQALVSSSPTSDYIFSLPNLDVRLLGRIDNWVSQVEQKDKYVNGHAVAVAEYAGAIARLLGLSPEEVADVKLAGIVHDIGKLGLSQQTLQKPESELSDAELVMTMNHTINGAKLLEGFPELVHLVPVVLAHHEEYDGNGYPEGLHGENIPLIARIIHVANSYHEMISDLVYRAGMPPEQAQNELLRGSGRAYDSSAVEALLACISQGLVPAKL